jgi:hypothetical protein
VNWIEEQLVCHIIELFKSGLLVGGGRERYLSSAARRDCDVDQELLLQEPFDIRSNIRVDACSRISIMGGEPIDDLPDRAAGGQQLAHVGTHSGDAVVTAGFEVDEDELAIHQLADDARLVDPKAVFVIHDYDALNDTIGY